jgi:peptidyl-dipeptidase Dcp
MNLSKWMALAAAVSACGGRQAHQSEPAATPETASSAPTQAADSARMEWQAARDKVARLKAEADRNPLLAPWTGPFGGVPPWDKVTPQALPATFEAGLALQAAEIDVIASNPEPPTFANTLVALEDLGRHLGRAQTLFSVHVSSLNTSEIQAIDQEWSPKFAAAADAIRFNQKLFARIAAVHQSQDRAGLTDEQKRLVTLTYDQFVQGGARLNAEEQGRLGRINEDLAGLFSQFTNKVLADENTWVVLDKTADLAGLPPSIRASYKAAAEERKLPGKWVVVNSRSSVDPFLTMSSRRDLREKVWKAFKNRGDNGDSSDTNGLISRIVSLRAERARLLGYPSHAHWRMANTMAVDPAKATDLMMRVWPAAVARVREEVSNMQQIADREAARITIEPWDYLFYAEKVRRARYALDQDALRPYFELNHMIAGSFYMAERLYGLQFTEVTGKVPVFHPDVRVWEVTDKATGAYRGLFYGDYFARPEKRSGAWASGYRGHQTFTGVTQTPIVSNNNNFVKAAPGEPVLMSVDDAQTLFHEFGHALHLLLSEVNYPGLTVTPRDFVEYPSQVHEMWLLTRPVLDSFALHTRTGKPMPQALIDRIERSKQFNQGYSTVEAVSSALVDMALHTAMPPPADPDAFERETLERIGAPREVAMRHRLPQFLHLFSSDSYSAGYYSYLWSEVMDADTRQAFEESGDVFDRATADRMRRFILAPGNSTDRTEAYRQFRGRDPDVGALLEKRGFQ